MKTTKKVKCFLKRNFFKIRFIIILLGTTIMFHALYFSDRPFILETLIKDRKEPRMYLCLLLSFGTALLIVYIIGYFNKQNVKKITSMEEFER